MIKTNGTFPTYAYYLEDPENQEQRELFKCRIESFSGNGYAQAIEGIIDISQGALIRTRKKFPVINGAKVILEDKTYSVRSVRPVHPDNVARGVRKSVNQVEYLVELV